MEDDRDYQEEPQEESLDFSQQSPMRRCPHCAETISSEELDSCFTAQTNTFTCPNCRKKLNIHELGNGI